MLSQYRCYVLLLSLLVMQLTVAGPCGSKPAQQHALQQSQAVTQKQEQEIDNPTDPTREFPVAVENNDYARVQALLEQHPELAVGADCFSYLDYAKNVRMAKLFKNAGLDLSKARGVGYSALNKVISSSEHDSALIEYYIDNGVNPNGVVANDFAPMSRLYDTICQALWLTVNRVAKGEKDNTWFDAQAQTIINKTCSLVRAGGRLSNSYVYEQEQKGMRYRYSAPFPWYLKYRLFTYFCSKPERIDCQSHSDVYDRIARQFLKLRAALIAETRDIQACRGYVMKEWIVPCEVGEVIAGYLGYEQEPTYEELEQAECTAVFTKNGATRKLLSMPENGIKPCYHPPFGYYSTDEGVCWGPCQEVCEAFGHDLTNKLDAKKKRALTYPGMKPWIMTIASCVKSAGVPSTFAQPN